MKSAADPALPAAGGCGARMAGTVSGGPACVPWAARVLGPGTVAASALGASTLGAPTLGALTLGALHADCASRAGLWPTATRRSSQYTLSASGRDWGSLRSSPLITGHSRPARCDGSGELPMTA